MPRTSTSAFHVAVDRIGVRLPGGRLLFRDLSLGFGDERTAVVGANGSGKSTLAHIVAGFLAPTEGHIVRHGVLGYLPQTPTRAAAGTVADLLGITATLDALDRLATGTGNAADVDQVGADWDLPARARTALERVGLATLGLQRSLGNISGGEETRLALAALLLREPDMLVLDEPTNHLDAAARTAVCRLVQGWTRGMLVVSHDRELLENVDRIVELSPLGARLYGGGYSAYREQRNLEEEAARRALDAAHTAVRRAERDVQATRERKEQRDARGRKSRAGGSQPKLVLNAKRERSQQTSHRLVAEGERVVGAERERLTAARERVELRETLDIVLPKTGMHARKRVIDAQSVSYTHPGAVSALVRKFSLSVVGGERIALIGANGSGKSTLLRLLAGRLLPNEGSVQLGVDSERLAMLEQHVEWPLPAASLLDNFLARHSTMGAGAARQALAAFLFRGDDALRPVATLSGGEMLRGALATLLYAEQPPLLLLLDEPTNHLDLDGVEAVERALRAYDGALVVVSHDERFLSAIDIQRRLRAPFLPLAEQVEVSE
jgi:ATPase subunit of ABC transporter with duplicated ATPase domains